MENSKNRSQNLLKYCQIHFSVYYLFRMPIVKFSIPCIGGNLVRGKRDWGEKADWWENGFCCADERVTWRVAGLVVVAAGSEPADGRRAEGQKPAADGRHRRARFLSFFCSVFSHLILFSLCRYSREWSFNCNN